jgi:hypothetical protein
MAMLGLKSKGMTPRTPPHLALGRVSPVKGPSGPLRQVGSSETKVSMVRQPPSHREQPCSTCPQPS